MKTDSPRNCDTSPSLVDPTTFRIADLPRPQRRPRRGQVHEIETRDHEDHNADDHEHVDVVPVAVRLELSVDVGVEMYAGQGLQVVFPEVPLRLPFLVPVRPHPLDHRLFHIFGYLLLQGGRRRAVGEHQVGYEIVGGPSRIVDGVGEARHRHEHVVMEMRVRRELLADARHGAGEAPRVPSDFQDQALAQDVLPPEILRAASLVITTVFGAASADPGSPYTSGWVNMPKYVESAPTQFGS